MSSETPSTEPAVTAGESFTTTVYNKVIVPISDPLVLVVIAAIVVTLVLIYALAIKPSGSSCRV